MRLFIGTFLDKELAEKIPLEDLKKLFDDSLKSVKRENIHMTWGFLGNVDDNKQLDLKEAIDKHLGIFKGLTFQSNQFEFWPPKKQPRLVVLTGSLNKEVNLTNLSNDLKNICEPDIKKDFLPHITILRFKQDKTVKREIALPEIDNFTWKIKELSLIQSVLSETGPAYYKVHNWIL